MLEVDRLVRRFGDVVALDGCSFTVAPGELCGFLGPNGAGKTTALRCTVGVTEPDAGEVRWRGAPIDLEVRRRTGYMPEERGLYPKMGVLEHIVYLGRLHGMPRHDAESSARAWVQQLGLAGRAHDHVETLSLGNQQRVQLAAALVHDPELLVLDEPLSGLDPLAVQVLSDVLRDRARAGVAVVFSSHQLDLVEELCRTVAVISAGRVVLAGELDALRRAGGLRLRVATDGPSSWSEVLPAGAERVAEHDGVVTIALGAEADVGPVLDAARNAGRLIRVELDQPRLTELFRVAIGAAAP